MPSITSVSGTWATGNSITITGSDFGTKSPVLPMVWAPLENASFDRDTDLSASATTFVTHGVTVAMSTDNPPSHRARSAKWDLDSTNEYFTYTNFDDESSFQDIYMFLRRRWNVTWNSPDNFKLIRPRPQLNQGKPNLIYVLQGGVLRFTIEGVTTTDNFNPDNSLPPVDTWIREELEFHHSAVDTADGFFRYTYNGVKRHVRDDIETRTTAEPENHNRIYFQGDKSGGSEPTGAGGACYANDVYMQNSLSRVMVADNTDFRAAGVHREIQIPTAWADTEITITAQQGEIGTFSGRSLFVVDSTNAVSSAFSINLGKRLFWL